MKQSLKLGLVTTALTTLLLGANGSKAQTWVSNNAPYAAWGNVASSADGTKLAAAAATGPIYVSTNSGVEWTATTSPSGKWDSLASSADGSVLLAVLSPSSVYTSTNSGATWSQRTGGHCVAASADGRKLVAVTSSAVSTSTNSGDTWTLTLVLPALHWQSAASSADGSKLAAVAQEGQIYTSADSGATWVSNSVPAEWWSSVGSSADGTKLVAVAGQANGRTGPIYLSTNAGATWTMADAPVINWVSVASSANGTKLIAAAAGPSSSSSANAIYFSTNSGATWVRGNAPNAWWRSIASSADASKLVGGAAFSIYTAQSVPAPELAIAPSGSDVLVSWVLPAAECVLQASTNLSTTNWVTLGVAPTFNPTTLCKEVVLSPASTRRFYRLAPSPPGMVLIPAGSFTMGDTFSEGAANELPLHSVYVSAFYMDKFEVTKGLWDEVYQWAITNGYSFDNAGSGKAANHPAQTVNWFDCVKWCNARSEKEGLVPAYCMDSAQTDVYRTGQVSVTNACVKWNAGYRLPTEAEWEKAARSGASGHRFPWSDVDTISHGQANYRADTNAYVYDVSPTQGYHPTYATGGMPYTSPVGSFEANGYGLYDMAGNAWEWCWDFGGLSYPSLPEADPRGPDLGTNRRLRGGSWHDEAMFARCAVRTSSSLTIGNYNFGFRCVRGL